LYKKYKQEFGVDALMYNRWGKANIFSMKIEVAVQLKYSHCSKISMWRWRHSSRVNTFISHQPKHDITLYIHQLTFCMWVVDIMGKRLFLCFCMRVLFMFWRAVQRDRVIFVQASGMLYGRCYFYVFCTKGEWIHA
jgi:hypothetical protein